MDTSDIMRQIQAPFSQDEIEWRIGSTVQGKNRGLALAYVTNRAIQNRLDNIFGCFGWRNEYKEWRGNSQLCGISIKFEGEWITKWDGADNTGFEGTKGGLSDSMKRAAYQWGIGRYLYNLDAQWVSIKQQGKSYVIDGEPPQLPSWALPDATKQPDTSRKQQAKQPTNQVDDKSPDLKKLEAITVVANVAKNKGWSQDTINAGIAKYFPGKTKLEQLTLTELHKLINRINASGGDGDKS